ncbi:MAG: universal stress protein, partial [Candidatus Krumholzibacteriia bacterium]
MDRLESIVVAVDFSECSASALAQAARMARDTGATLHVLHVLESLVMTDAIAGIATSEEALRALVVSETEKKLRSLLPDAERPENLQVDVRVGSPIADVLDKVREVSADLLVLGAQGACGTRKRL